MLFLRPGYDMLVEWGNSGYIDQDGKITTGLNSVSNIYAKHAFQKKIDIRKFSLFCRQ